MNSFKKIESFVKKRKHSEIETFTTTERQCPHCTSGALFILDSSPKTKTGNRKKNEKNH